MPYLTWKSFEWKLDPFLIFEAIKDKENVFFLDSSLHKGSLGRYSFLGFEPFYVLKGKPGSKLQRDKKREGGFKRGRQEIGVFSDLRGLLKRYKLENKYNFPLPAGAVGYFAYDLGLGLEKIEGRAEDDLGLADLYFGFYDTIIAIDHWQKKLIISSCGFPEKNYLLAKKKAGQRLKQFIQELSKINVLGARSRAYAYSRQDRSRTIKLTSNFSKEKYFRAIARAKDYIRKGDIYQVNLSQRFSGKSALSSFELYKRLRRASPSDFSAYLDCGDFQILSSSPERFLYFDGKKVSSRPMKGTRPRGTDKQSDLRQKQALLESAKDKAELLMIVDLLRNDLGRVCKYGSIKVTSLRALEAYSTVYQTTAAIEGILHQDKDRVDLLKACFPGGSITGCPKIRSMQLIAELEPTQRSIYTGSLGYLGFDNTMDLNILIRTILKKNDTIYFQAGGGIVADSQPESEYQETLTKTQGIFKALKCVPA